MMKQRRELLWLTASSAALLVFSFTAGYGLRELYALARGTSGPKWEAANQVIASYRRIASRTGPTSEPDMGPPQLYAEVLDRLRTLYVEKLPENTTLSYSSIEQMLATLDDPNTRLLLPAEAAALKAAEEGNLNGLGAVLTVRQYPTPGRQSSERNLTVVAPLPGSAAEKAGLLPGDRITEIDGRWIAPVHLWSREMAFMTDTSIMSGAESRWQPRQSPPDEEEKPKSNAEQRKQAQEAADKLAAKWRNSTDIPAALEMLMTTANGEHTLTIERAGQPKPRQVKVTCGPLQVAPVTKRLLPGNIGHLQVRQLSAQTVTEVAAALKELRDAGAQSLILDLRRSPGGSLDAAQQIAGLFLPGGTMGLYQVRDERRKLIDKPLGVKPPAATAPKFDSMAVLVDGGTAGASEVLAAALRDHGATKLYGSNTFGDGTEQIIMPLDNGAAVSVTSGRFLTSKKVSFDKTGLKPDVVVPAPTGPGLDRQLEQAVKSLRA